MKASLAEDYSSPLNSLAIIIENQLTREMYRLISGFISLPLIYMTIVQRLFLPASSTGSEMWEGPNKDLVVE